MPDDLLTTVKAALNGYARHGFYSVNFQPHEALSAILARCEAAEGCDGNCSCVVMSRHEWQRAYSEERLKREAAEAEVERLNSPVLKSDWQQMVAERDALRLMNDPEGGEKQTLIARLVKAESELAAARAEAAQLVKLFNVDTAELREQRYAALQQRDAARAEVERLTKELEAAHFVRAKIENAPLTQARAEVERQGSILRQLATDGRLWIDLQDLQNNRVRLVYEPEHESELVKARAEAARLKKELAAKIPGQVVQSIRDDRDRLRAEVARLRDARADDVALVARLSQQVVALRGAITRVLDGPHYIDRDYQDVLFAALDTPAREGGEGR